METLSAPVILESLLAAQFSNPSAAEHFAANCFYLLPSSEVYLGHWSHLRIHKGAGISHFSLRGLKPMTDSAEIEKHCSFSSRPDKLCRNYLCSRTYCGARLRLGLALKWNLHLASFPSLSCFPTPLLVSLWNTSSINKQQMLSLFLGELDPDCQ